MDIIGALGSIKPEQWAGILGGLLAIVKVTGPLAEKLITRRFKRAAHELDALSEQEIEKAHAAELFAKDKEIISLHGRSRLLQASRDSAIADKLSAEWRVHELEEVKLALEEQLARYRAGRATGKHLALPPSSKAHALPPAIPDVTDQLDTARPRSASRQLPPLTTTVKPVRPNK